MPSTRAQCTQGTAGSSENTGVVEDVLDPGINDLSGSSESRSEEDPLVEGEAGQALNLIRSVFRQELEKERNQIYETLDKKLSENNEIFANRVKGHLNLIKEEAKVQEKPNFKARGNEKHYTRTQRYLQFCLEIRTAICEGDSEGALASVDALSEALKSFQRDICIADQYDGGWTLVDRFRGEEDSEAATLRKLNQKILDERAAFKRKNESRGSTSKSVKSDAIEDRGLLSNLLQYLPRAKQDGAQVPADLSRGSSGQSQPSSKIYGPCIWCNQKGHGFKYCSEFEKDLSDGKARYNPATRRWEKV